MILKEGPNDTVLHTTQGCSPSGHGGGPKCPWKRSPVQVPEYYTPRYHCICIRYSRDTRHTRDKYGTQIFQGHETCSGDKYGTHYVTFPLNYSSNLFHVGTSRVIFFKFLKLKHNASIRVLYNLTQWKNLVSDREARFFRGRLQFDSIEIFEAPRLRILSDKSNNPYRAFALTLIELPKWAVGLGSRLLEGRGPPLPGLLEHLSYQKQQQSIQKYCIWVDTWTRCTSRGAADDVLALRLTTGCECRRSDRRLFGQCYPNQTVEKAVRFADVNRWNKKYPFFRFTTFRKLKN